MNRETYAKFEDFAKRAVEGKAIGEIYYQPATRLEWEERQVPNGTQKVPRLLASIRLTATDSTLRHLEYTEFLVNELILDEAQGKAAQDRITAGLKAMIERLQDKCPKCRLFEGGVEA